MCQDTAFYILSASLWPCQKRFTTHLLDYATQFKAAIKKSKAKVVLHDTSKQYMEILPANSITTELCAISSAECDNNPCSDHPSTDNSLDLPDLSDFHDTRDWPLDTFNLDNAISEA